MSPLLVVRLLFCFLMEDFAEKDSMSQIPNVCIVATGCRVVLTKNQKSMTKLGLNNGAIGTVVAIVYNKGKKPPTFPEFIVVDFPKYKGPPMYEEHPTWVPITVNTVHCEHKCCMREGYPLKSGYAITIAKSQGLTIGKDELVTCAIIKLSPKIDMEKLCYGLAYTALSRVSEDEDWCLAEAIPFERLQYLNRHPKKKVREHEENRLKAMSEIFVSKNKCSVSDYLNLLKQIDIFCNDGISDAVCQDGNQCSCVYHQSC